MVSLPKINLGRKTKKNFFDLSHDVNTTCDFGFCQPTLCHEIQPHSHFTLESKSFIRLAPMPAPTFGRVKVYQNTLCVPHSDVFEAFKQFLGHESVNVGSFSYVPESTDMVSSETLRRIFWNMGILPSSPSINGLSSVDFSRSLFTLSLYSDVPISSDEVGNYTNRSIGLRDIWNTEKYYTSSDLNTNYVSLVNAYNVTSYVWNDILVNFFGTFSPSNSSENLPGYPLLNGSSGVGNPDIYPAFPLFVSRDSLLINTSKEMLWNKNLGSWDLWHIVENNMSPALRQSFKHGRSLENADFVLSGGTIHIGSSMAFWENIDDTKDCSGDFTFVVGIHLTPLGKRLFKLFQGLGMPFSALESNYSLIPLLSYYKAWFDTYNVGRERNWFETNAYRCIHNFFDCPYTLESLFSMSMDDATNFGSISVKDGRKFWYDFFFDLLECNFTLPADNITVATENPIEDNNNNSLSDGVIVGYQDNEVHRSSPVVYDSDSYQYPTIGATILDSLSLKLLERLYPVVNRWSVLGHKLDDYLRNKYGITLPKSNFVGSSDFLIDISDVFSTVNNDSSYLGEFAGKGIGSGQSGKMYFENGDDYCTLIQMISVVPLGGYSQGFTPHHIKPLEFYQPEYDSLGMEAFTTQQVNSDNVIFNDELALGVHYRRTFGFRPRYFHMKVKNNLRNGGFALRSERTQFEPYYLDRLFSMPDYVASELPMYVGTRYHLFKPTQVTPNEKLRYVGLNETFGNFNRIFYDVSGSVDNFILTMYQDFKYYASMKSVSDSYDTYDPEIDDNSSKVEHS